MGWRKTPACSAASALTSTTTSGATLVSGTESRPPPNRPVPMRSGHGWAGRAGGRAARRRGGGGGGGEGGGPPRGLPRRQRAGAADDDQLAVADQAGDQLARPLD